MPQNIQTMYNELKRLWLSTRGPDVDRDDAQQDFDSFITGLINHGARAGDSAGADLLADENDDADLEISQGHMLMEIILELDTSTQMVPPRVKIYRDLLAQQGLDRTSETPGEYGQRGIAGINLADQAALEFHRALLGLSISIAQAEVQERMEKRNQEKQ